MKEQTETPAGLHYSETFIGDCVSGECDRPATVRVNGSFVLCALHYLKWELSQEVNQSSLGLELLQAWRDQAEMHRLEGLAEKLDRIMEAEELCLQVATSHVEQLDQADEEANPDETRQRMGKKRREFEAEGGKGVS